MPNSRVQIQRLANVRRGLRFHFSGCDIARSLHQPCLAPRGVVLTELHFGLRGLRYLNARRGFLQPPPHFSLTRRPQPLAAQPDLRDLFSAPRHGQYRFHIAPLQLELRGPRVPAQAKLFGHLAPQFLRLVWLRAPFQKRSSQWQVLPLLLQFHGLVRLRGFVVLV